MSDATPLDPSLVKRLQSMPQEALYKEFRTEAAAHRDVTLMRGARVAERWRTFRNFLMDLGPAPSPDHSVHPLGGADDLSFGPGKAAWMTKAEKARYDLAQATRRLADASADGAKTPESVARDLGVPVGLVNAAVSRGGTLDDFVARAKFCDGLINPDANWLPPEPARRTAFLTTFRFWHLQTAPKFSRQAIPAFLYLYSALPGLVEARTTLEAAELWNPLTDRVRRARDEHPAWRRYNEFLPRVQAAMIEVPALDGLSMFEGLDKLLNRVVELELKYRLGDVPRGRRAA